MTRRERAELAANGAAWAKLANDLRRKLSRAERQRAAARSALLELALGNGSQDFRRGFAAGVAAGVERGRALFHAELMALLPARKK